jgi:twitching motility protein PilJ
MDVRQKAYKDKEVVLTPAQRQRLGACILAGIVAMFITILLTWQNQRIQSYQSGQLKTLDTLQTHITTILKTSNRLWPIHAEDLEVLVNHHQSFKNTLALLEEPQQSTPWGIGSFYKEISSGQLAQKWATVSLAIEGLNQQKDTLLSYENNIQELENRLPKAQVALEDIGSILLQTAESPSSIAVVVRQSWLAERMLSTLAKMKQSDSLLPQTVSALSDDNQLFAKVLSGLQGGNQELGISPISHPRIQSILGELQKEYKGINTLITQMSNNYPALKKVESNIQLLSSDSAAVSELLSQVISKGLEFRPSFFVGVMIRMLFLLSSLLLFGVALLLYHRYASIAYSKTVGQHKANRSAVWRLLDEIATLAEGDLTIQATVGDDLTGAIAESVNYAIEALRKLVATINKTAKDVTVSAQTAQQTAQSVADASSNQARAIVDASAAINAIAMSIDDVSKHAEQSAEVAEKSVKIAGKGAEVVKTTMEGMERIRMQIQQTAKQIKRLGESSQEIGHIISLIKDIAEQTNILALNAAIQAAMAGDAGRGFAVVADEVQRLAEKSSEATKQIETIVKTIQTDTQDTVTSMEQTTSEVVEGARSAHNAGEALENIEAVSHTLSEHIQNIFKVARIQADTSAKVSKTMNVIQEITTQTASGTTATAGSIGELSELAQALEHSVDGFKLPNKIKSEA